MSRLAKLRDGARSAWSRSRDGTKRTAAWVKGGVTGAAGRVRSAAAGLRGGDSDGAAAEDPGPVRDRLSGAWDRIGGASLLQRARSDSRVRAALIVGAIVFVLWIAWTVYVWTENGAAAGLGVLISWPAVLAALALLAAPFVAAVVLLRRHAANGGPSLALAGGGTEAAAEAEGEDEGDAGSEDEGEGDGEGEGEGEDDGEGNGEDEDEGEGEAGGEDADGGEGEGEAGGEDEDGGEAGDEGDDAEA